MEDIRLAERFARALRATGRGPLLYAGVTVTPRIVSLEQEVPSYFLKQVAQAAALSVPGVRHVRNGLKVGRPR